MNLTRAALLLGAYYEEPYEPRLYAIDNFKHTETTANSVPSIAARLGLAELLDARAVDLADFPDTCDDNVPDLDLIWFDCGNMDIYFDQIPRYFEMLNGDGGLFVIHSTLTNLQAQFFMGDLKLRQATQSFQDFELISFLEPHKFRQNSFTVLRKTTQLQRRIYTQKS